MIFLFLGFILLQWLSTRADYCQSLVQDCRSDESDSLADFQEMFVHYQQECDEKEYFQILSVEKASRIYQCRYSMNPGTVILSISHAWLM